METAVLDEATRAYLALQEQILAATPLAQLSAWIAAGKAPSAAALREFGFRSDNPHEEHAQKLRLARKAFTRRWGFAIPCAEAIGALHALGPMVEIGAGTGYWSALLSAAGQDMIATDPAAGERLYGFEAGAHFPMTKRDAVSAIRAYPERAVFCCWPTEGADWAAEAAALIAPGQRLALIGEPRGGCTGSTALFDLLDAAFVLERDVELPQFPRVNDSLRIYRRL